MWVNTLEVFTGDPVSFSSVYSLCIFSKSCNLSIDQETELEELCMMYIRRGFPFSDDQLCSLALELAKQTRRPGFSPVKKRAGRKWLKGFMKSKPILQKKNAHNLEYLCPKQYGF